MGSAYDARIDGNSLPPANSFNHSLLQEPQQLDLKRQRNVAHFVQKQRAPIGLFDLALGRFDGAREGPFFVAEQRSEEHTSELQSLMRISYAVFCLKQKKNKHNTHNITV